MTARDTAATPQRTVLTREEALAGKRGYWVFRRAQDILFSALALIVLLIPMRIVALLIVVIWGSVRLTGFDLGIIMRRGHQLTVILGRIFHPDFSYFNKVVEPLLDTIKMSILGSVLGATLALPFAAR